MRTNTTLRCAKALVLSLIFSYSSQAQDVWQEQNNTGANLWGIDFADENLGVTGGNWGELYKTNDGGSTWLLDQNFQGGTVREIDFVSPTHGWMAASNLYYTDDAAITWWYVPTPAVFVTDIFMLDEQYGFIAGTGDFLSTVDGGVNWVTRFSFGQGFNISDIFFLDPSNGWLTSLDGGVWKTIDGGDQWTLQYGPQGYDFKCVYMVDANTGWLGGGTNTCPSFARLWKTTDGGMNWIEQTMDPDHGAVQDIHFNTNGSVAWLGLGSWCSTDRGGMLRSFDGGTNWVEDVLPNTQPVADICIYDEYNTWTVGHDGQVNSFSSSVGVEENVLDGVQLFIDPAQNTITVSGLNGEADLNVSLVSMDGKVFATEQVAGQKVFVYPNSLSAGVYVARVQQGIASKSLKFVHQIN